GGATIDRIGAGAEHVIAGGAVAGRAAGLRGFASAGTAARTSASRSAARGDESSRPSLLQAQLPADQSRAARRRRRGAAGGARLHGDAALPALVRSAGAHLPRA